MINFETVKCFTNEDFELKRYVEAVAQYQKYGVATKGALNTLNSIQELLIKATLLAILMIMAASVYHSEMSIGSFMTVNAYIAQLFQPLNFLGNIYGNVIEALADMQNLGELLAVKAEISDIPGAKSLDLGNPVNGRFSSNSSHDGVKNIELVPSLQCSYSAAHIEFKGVHFHYPNQAADLGLQDLSFVVKPGTTTALVGQTGSGKTTIYRLLFRFYDVLRGSILINGQDIRHVTQKSLRKAIAVVPQVSI